MQAGNPPLVTVVYLVVAREQNPEILNEFTHSVLTLRRFHPDVPVLVYQENLTHEQLDFIRRLGCLDFPIACDRSGRFRPHFYRMRHGWRFPELYVLASKLDVLLLTPGDTLFLDTDTEVRASLDEVFAWRAPALHESEGLLREHERHLDDVLASTQWSGFGWRGDTRRLRMFNTGSIWVPQTYKQHLYPAKEFLWSLLALPAEERGDNRLDEQLAISIALQEATDCALAEIAPRVYHYWREKYEGETWYERRFEQLELDGEKVVVPPADPDPEVRALLEHAERALAACS